MDLRQQLSLAHSRANADLILTWLYADEARTRVLIDLVNSKDERDAKPVQRAAMVLGDLGRAKPDWLRPYQRSLLRLANEATHPALPRAISRYFSELPISQIDEPTQGPLLDFSFRKLADRSLPVTVRVFSMTTLANFAERYPELKEEITELIRREINEGVATPGFTNRGKKTIERLAR